MKKIFLEKCNYINYCFLNILFLKQKKWKKFHYTSELMQVWNGCIEKERADITVSPLSSKPCAQYRRRKDKTNLNKGIREDRYPNIRLLRELQKIRVSNVVLDASITLCSMQA